MFSVQPLACSVVFRGERFYEDVIFDQDYTIKARWLSTSGDAEVVRLRATHVDTTNSRQQVDALKEVEAFQERALKRQRVYIPGLPV